MYRLKNNFWVSATIILIISVLAVACTSNEPKAMKLSIVHINDHHSHLEPSTLDIQLAGEKTRVALGGFAHIVTVINDYKEKNPNTLTLHAGDAMTGTIYYSLFQGESDASVMNEIEWDAFALGNHEFDGGNEVLSNFLKKLKAPAIAANVVPDKGSILYKAWTPYRIVRIDGQKVGLIGIDIVGKTKNSSNPGDDIAFFDEIETTAKYVKELTEKGINKIMVVSHIGHDNALTLASQVNGVDIIINGDSHTLEGGDNERILGLSPLADYPTIVKSPEGAPVVVLQAWEYSKVVGTLEVAFDQNGVVENADGTVIFPLSDTFLRKNAEGKRVEVEGAARQAIYDDIASNPILQIVEADQKTQEIIDTYKVKKEELGAEVVGVVTETIAGGSSVRIPFIENGVQQSHGTAQLVANASLDTLQSIGSGDVDVFIQNAGGVRIPLNQGDVTVETMYTLLPFGNTSVTIQLTGAEIQATLEDSIDYALNPQGSTGAFPYTAGLRYKANLDRKKGSRTNSLEVYTNNTWVPLDANATYNIGINSYIARGKDGYTTLGNIAADKKTDTFLVDAEIMTEYVKNHKEISPPDSISVTLEQ